MADADIHELIGKAREKSLELHARVSVMDDEARAGRDISLILEMVEQSQQAIGFYVGLIRAEARK